jgi:poly(hydroxyalkanoate) synthase III subunit E
MENNSWRQWQAYVDLMFPGAASGFAQTPKWFLPYADAAERFSSDARRFFEASRDSATPAADAAQAFGDSLREQFADFFPKLWGMDSLKVPPSMAWPSGGDMPALGLTREHQLRWQKTLEAWERMSAAQRRLQRLWSDVLQEAATAFAGPLAAASRSPPSDDALHALYDSWIDCAEQAYARAAHGEKFSEAMAEFVNASSNWRRQLKEGVEQYAKLLDLPTRAEINALLLRLKALEEKSRATPQGTSRPKSSPKAHHSPAKKRKTAARRGSKR